MTIFKNSSTELKSSQPSFPSIDSITETPKRTGKKFIPEDLPPLCKEVKRRGFRTKAEEERYPKELMRFLTRYFFDYTSDSDAIIFANVKEGKKRVFKTFIYKKGDLNRL